MSRVGVFEDAGRWAFRCGNCGTLGTPVETRVAARAAYRAHRQQPCDAAMKGDEKKPVRGRPRIIISTEKIQGVFDRLRAGATMRDEAAQLGMHYQALRNMLEEVLGIGAYLQAMTEQRIKRAKLPPSKNFLVPDVPAQNVL